MKPVGHKWLVSRLSEEVPPVSLVVGPASVGKRTVLRWALREVVGEDGLLSFAHIGIDDAREIRRFLVFRPSVPKAVFFRLDGSSPQAVNALLKVLEEPFEQTYVAMTSEQSPLETVASRAFTFRVAYLSDDEVAEVLGRLGYTEDEATDRARLAGGSVQRALASDPRRDMGPVLAILRALSMKDQDLLLATLLSKRSDGYDAVGAEQVRLLRTWAQERVSGRWRVFDQSDAYGIPVELAVRVYDSLRVPTRPRVAVKRAVLPEMERES